MLMGLKYISRSSPRPIATPGALVRSIETEFLPMLAQIISKFGLASERQGHVGEMLLIRPKPALLPLEACHIGDPTQERHASAVSVPWMTAPTNPRAVSAIPAITTKR